MPNKENNTIALDFFLILLPTIQDLIFWEEYYKRYLFLSFGFGDVGFGDVEVVFALHTGIIIFYMGIFLIEIRVDSFWESSKYFFFAFQ